MSLAGRQAEFMAQVMDEAALAPADDHHRAGMTIYRTGYRARMVEVLEELYERTREAAGSDTFRQAAINHLIACPASGWRIEDCGEAFGDTLADFASDQQGLAELAALEWAMHRAANAEDVEPVPLEAFGAASATFAEADWVSLLLRFVPGLSVVPVTHDLAAFWRGDRTDLHSLAHAASAIVWREGERPTFLQLSAAEGEALSAMQRGATYGEACAILIGARGEEAGVALAGEALGRWIGEGLVTGLAQ